MQKVPLLLVLVVCVYVASAMPVERVLKQTAHSCILNNNCMSRDWVKGARANPKDYVRLVFAVRQKNLDKLEKIVMEVSDPASPKYGKHLTHAQIGELTKDEEAVAAVHQFLNRHGLKRFRTLTNGEFVVARMTVAKAEELLATEFFVFHSAALDNTAIRTLQYTLPAWVSPFIDFVGYTVQFPPTTRKQPSIVSYDRTGAPTGTTTPDLIASFYHIASRTIQNKGATQSLFESLGQSFSPADLASFENKYNIPSQPIAQVIGPNKGASCASDPNNCVEANLDVQYIIAIAEGAPTTFWSIPSSNNDIFLEWILAVQDASNPPLVHSMSYGSVEEEEVQSDMQAFNTAAQKLGAQGLTILIASGDDGVANFEARNNPAKCGFHPSYPATIPYVTAVGATQGPEYGQTEVACSSATNGLITTGGGFSTIFTSPSYQTNAVNEYFSSGVQIPPTTMFNKAGRGYPDIALLGHNYDVCIAGQFYQVSGTSCSTPTVAGMISLINDARLSIGKSSLGFINPALYGLAANATTNSPFNDITSGENNCCAGNEGSQTCCKYGFFAAKGWDPLTGFGSIDFANLLSTLQSL